MTAVAETTPSGRAAARALQTPGERSEPVSEINVSDLEQLTSIATTTRPTGVLVGYARVSTRDQDPALQLDALQAAGCERIFTEAASGAVAERPELARVLDYVRPGDTL